MPSLDPPAPYQAAPVAEVVTQRIVLTDAAGRIRAELAIDNSDNPRLTLWGKDGLPRVTVELDCVNEEPNIFLDSANDRGSSLMTALSFSVTDEHETESSMTAHSLDIRHQYDYGSRL